MKKERKGKNLKRSKKTSYLMHEGGESVIKISSLCRTRGLLDLLGGVSSILLDLG